jgi:elongation factor 1-alpha
MAVAIPSGSSGINITIAVVGNVDAAKSSTIGVLSTKKLDNGRGEARLAVLSQKHEKETGRTSNINIIRISEESVNIRLLDLAGHEAYLKTTLRGLTNYFPDYAMLVISLVDGISKVTTDHLRICRSLGIPVIIVLTKQDACQPEMISSVVKNMKVLCKLMEIKYTSEIKDNDSLKTISDLFSIDPKQIAPYVIISNTTGYQIPLLRKIIFGLPDPRTTNAQSINHSINDFVQKQSLSVLFFIQKTYFVKGVGLVVYGINKGNGSIFKNDKIYVGPIGSEYVEVRVRSIHSEFSELIDALPPGQVGCLAIKPVDSKTELHRHSLRNGRVAISKPICVNEVQAKIYILHHSTTINLGYSPYIHCANVSVTAKIIDTSCYPRPVRSKMKVDVIFQFPSPQFIYPGAKLLFRDGNIKGLGRVDAVYVRGEVRKSLERIEE